jgi:hypothetical protein
MRFQEELRQFHPKADRRYSLFFALLSLFIAVPCKSVADRPAGLSPAKGGTWLTYGLALPRQSTLKPAGNRQVDVKCLWPDGSIRFAVVTEGPPAQSESFAPSVPDVQVQLLMDAESWTATLPTERSTDLWLSGALVKEWRSKASFVNGSQVPHPFLVCWFDTRCYQDGACRVDVVVENCLDSAAAHNAKYSVEIKASGKTLFHQSGVTQYYLTRWRKVFWIAGRPAEPRENFEPFYASHALPRPLPGVARRKDAVSGPKFEILQGATLNPYMPDHGGRPELAPYPDWTMRYLRHKERSQREFVLANGDLAGSWPIHVREPKDDQLASIEQRPEFWLDSRAPAGKKPAGTPVPDMPYGPDPRKDPSKCPLLPDSAHAPSLAYVPYLLTGDRYYCDEMRFWADFGLLRLSPKRRGGAAGHIIGGGEPRASAWTLRNLADAAAYLPDGDPFKDQFTRKVRMNLEWIEQWAQAQATPLGPAWLQFAPPIQGHNNRAWISLPQNIYLAWAIDRANQQGFEGGLTWRDQMARFVLDLFTNPGWRREDAGPYRIAVANRKDRKKLLTERTDPETDASVTYMTSLAEAYAASKEYKGAMVPLKGWYGGADRLMLMIAIKKGWPGAREAYNWLTPVLTRERGGRGIPDLASRAGWALELEKESQKLSQE